MPVTPLALSPRKNLRPAPSMAHLPPLQSVRVLDQLRERLRFMHYSLRTEEAYVYWTKAFIRFHGIRHPAALGGPEVEEFLMHLANERAVSPSTHSQALSALLFFYTKVLGHDLPWLKEIGHPRRHRRLPVVEGLRRTKALQLRVKDLRFAQRRLMGQARSTRVVPSSARPATRCRPPCPPQNLCTSMLYLRNA